MRLLAGTMFIAIQGMTLILAVFLSVICFTTGDWLLGIFILIVIVLISGLIIDSLKGDDNE